MQTKFLAGLISLSLIAAWSAPVRAECRTEIVLTGNIPAGETDWRSFNLTPGGAIFTLQSLSNQDLSFAVYRPGKSQPICDKGPGRTLTCNPQTGHGRFRIFITNESGRSAPYSLACDNPP